MESRVRWRTWRSKNHRYGTSEKIASLRKIFTKRAQRKQSGKDFAQDFVQGRRQMNPLGANFRKTQVAGCAVAQRARHGGGNLAVAGNHTLPSGDSSDLLTADLLKADRRLQIAKCGAPGGRALPLRLLCWLRTRKLGGAGNRSAVVALPWRARFVPRGAMSLVTSTST